MQRGIETFLLNSTRLSIRYWIAVNGLRSRKGQWIGGYVGVGVGLSIPAGTEASCPTYSGGLENKPSGASAM
jgi:hypothetical protein